MESQDKSAEETPDAGYLDGDENPQEFAQALESDPAYNPDDEELKREKGG